MSNEVWQLHAGVGGRAVVQRVDGNDEATNMSPREFDRQVWPKCRRCGTRVRVDRIDATGFSSEARVIPGQAYCPRGCDRCGL